MRKLTMMAAAVLAAAGMAAPALAAERGWPVASFDRVRVEGPFDVRVATGGAARVRASGPQDVLDRLIVSVERGTLVIRAERSGWNWGQWLKPNETLVVSVGLPALRGVSLVGSGDVTVDRVRGALFDASLGGSGDIVIRDLQADAVSLSLRGSGDLTATGRAGRITADLAGSGDLRAGGLVGRTAAVSLVGSGHLTVGARDTASVSLVGSGDVRITGGARCTTSKRGSGDVYCG